MYRHIMTDVNNHVISISFLSKIIPASGRVVPTNIPVDLGWVYDPVNNIYSPPSVAVDPRQIFTVDNFDISANEVEVVKFAGNYYCESGDIIQIQGNLLADGQPVNTTIPVTLKMPVVRHANGQPTTDEIYFNVTLQDGVLTARGKIERSGDWKVLIDRNNEALQRIGAGFKILADDITILA